MKKLAVIIVLTVVLLLTGCAQSTPTTNLPDSTPATNSPNTSITYIEDKGIPVLPEGFGLYGCQVEFDGVYPGWIGTVPLTIVNGQDRDRLFVISVRQPSKVRADYEAFPQEYFYWITIAEPEVTVATGQTYQIPITLAMPVDADCPSKKYEVRILVEDTTQTGLVQIALETKWFIITAN